MNKNEYYRNQISVNTEEVSKLYMRGVYEHADVFHTSLFKFDSEKFVPYLRASVETMVQTLSRSLSTCC